MDNFSHSVKRFDEFAAEYAARFMDIEMYRSLIDHFCELVPCQNPRILELACGPGNYTHYIRQLLPESVYLATDLAPGMLEIARKNAPGVDFRMMDMRELKLLQGPFDAIFCSFGLPFLSTADAIKLIGDCAEKLVKGGVLYISTMEGEEQDAGFEPTSFSGKAEVYFNYHREEDLKNAFLKNDLVLESMVKQDYHDPDGTVLVDMIFIGKKDER
ncbi:MAG: class I SAM-dependent methyltransferase [Bacteroidales bacterium]